MSPAVTRGGAVCTLAGMQTGEAFRTATFTVLLLVVVVALWALRDVLILVGYSALLAFALEPAVTYLESPRIRAAACPALRRRTGDDPPGGSRCVALARAGPQVISQSSRGSSIVRLRTWIACFLGARVDGDARLAGISADLKWPYAASVASSSGAPSWPELGRALAISVASSGSS